MHNEHDLATEIYKQLLACLIALYYGHVKMGSVNQRQNSLNKYAVGRLQYDGLMMDLVMLYFGQRPARHSFSFSTSVVYIFTGTNGQSLGNTLSLMAMHALLIF